MNVGSAEHGGNAGADGLLRGQRRRLCASLLEPPSDGFFTSDFDLLFPARSPTGGRIPKKAAENGNASAMRDSLERQAPDFLIINKPMTNYQKTANMLKELGEIRYDLGCKLDALEAEIAAMDKEAEA